MPYSGSYGAGKLLNLARGDFNGMWFPEEECVLQVTEISLGPNRKIQITLSDTIFYSRRVRVLDSEKMKFVQRIKLFDLIGIYRIDLEFDHDPDHGDGLFCLKDFWLSKRCKQLIGKPTELVAKFCLCKKTCFCSKLK